MVRLHTQNQLLWLPGSASKVCVGGGWSVVVEVESEFSDRLWLSFSALAKPNKIFTIILQYLNARHSNSATIISCQHWWLMEMVGRDGYDCFYDEV
jgi:hypothetical protein